MAKISGYQCDICPTLSTEEGFPSGWISVRLPNNNGGEIKELCSNKCLLTLAKGRMETNKSERTELQEFFATQGLKASAIGPKMRVHTNNNHDLNPNTDCIICQFYAGGK